MAKYTVVIEDGSGIDPRIWQALAPAETTDGESAEDVAVWTAGNQTVVDGGRWRVRVWPGADADTGIEPEYEYYSES